MTKRNHFDENGNYINEENLTLAEIYMRGMQKGADSERVKRVMAFTESSTPLVARWRKPATETPLDLVVCSNCIMPLLKKDTDGTGNYVPFDFCPFCGARMEKPAVITEADEAMRDAETASKYLDDDEDTIAGRWHS